MYGYEEGNVKDVATERDVAAEEDIVAVEAGIVASIHSDEAKTNVTADNVTAEGAAGS